MRPVSRLQSLAFVALLAFSGATAAAADRTILNVSYDPTRELYRAYDVLFAAHWAETHGGEAVTVEQSHGGSGAQARAVIEGQPADVVTLALAADIDAIARTGRIAKDWQARLPDASAPYTSTIVFLVRKGNPKGIRDWDDLAKPGVQVITPNPKTSGGARWNFLAAWAYADEKFGHDLEKNKAFVAALFRNVPVLDSGARGSTTTFAQRGIGDVLLSWENEAYLAMRELGQDRFDDRRAVAVDPGGAAGRGGRCQCRSARHARPRRSLSPLSLQRRSAAADRGQFLPPAPIPTAADPEDLERFPALKLVDIDDPLFGGWAKAQSEHFGEGGTFDQIFQRR